MNVLTIYVGGVPASGKSTLFRCVRQRLFARSADFKEGSCRGVFAEGGKLLMLGVFDGSMFEGTDRLAMTAIDDCLSYIRKLEGEGERKAAVIEDGVPSPQERLDAIKRIANADAGGATLRLRPFIIGVSTPTYTELIRRGGEAGATALSTEFFCMDVRAKSLRSRMPMFNKMCGFDLWAFYRKYSQHGGYMRLNRKVKEPFILKMKEACDRAGMRFYVSDAHFKELCANGSCCGLPPDWNYSRGQFCEALIIARKKGVVKWADISADVERLHGGYLWKHATGYNKQTSEITAKFSRMTMAEYLRWLWNSPSAGQSPYSMFGGIVKPDGKDADGNIIYKYTGVMTHLPSSPCQHCDK